MRFDVGFWLIFGSVAKPSLTIKTKSNVSILLKQKPFKEISLTDI